MSTFAVAHLRNVILGPAIQEYLERIDETLAPYDGRFVVHGGPREPLEGQWSDDLVIIEFPSRRHARSWYRSAAYQAILTLRMEHAEGEVFLIESVPSGHRATDVLAG
jgi:uncharacterized protein (DUF1330 family)